MSDSKPVVLEAKLRFAQGMWDFSLSEYGGSAVADLTMSDGTTQHFGWFHDEISYGDSEFVGKTMDEIRVMHYQRDVAYLRS
jgi:hypothetical protein